jgi:hypothetical protein
MALRHLDLGGACLGEGGCLSLVPVLKELRGSLQRLDLSNNCLGTAALEALGAMLEARLRVVCVGGEGEAGHLPAVPL